MIQSDTQKASLDNDELYINTESSRSNAAATATPTIQNKVYDYMPTNSY